MPKAPCARLMKFIMPSVTDRPTDSRNSSMPKAKPSNRTMAIWLIMQSFLPDRAAGWSPDGGLFHLCRESPREAPAYQSTPSQPPPVQGEGAKRGVRWIALRGLLRPVQRILDVGDFVQDHVLQLPIHFLDFADIDGLHDIAG